MDQITVIQGLQAEIGKLAVALGPQRLAQPRQIIFGKLMIQQAKLGAALDIPAEIERITFAHLRLGGLRRRGLDKAQGLAPQLIQQQPGGDISIIGLRFQKRARAHDQRIGDIGLRHPVKQILQGLIKHQVGLNALKTGAGLGHDRLQPGHVQRRRGAVGQADIERGGRAVVFGLGPGGRPLAGVFLPINHIGARDLLFAGPHQRQLNLILNIFDMHDAALRHAPGQGIQHLAGEGFDHLMHPA